MEKEKMHYPKWLYSRTKGGKIFKDAFEESQIDEADEYRDTPWPEPPKVATNSTPGQPCKNCEDIRRHLANQEAKFDKAYGELKTRYETLKAEFTGQEAILKAMQAQAAGAGE